jgi:hypothetical protein
MVDDQTAVYFGHGGKEKRAKHVTQKVYGHSERGEDSAGDVEVLDELCSPGGEHNRGKISISFSQTS